MDSCGDRWSSGRRLPVDPVVQRGRGGSHCDSVVSDILEGPSSPLGEESQRNCSFCFCSVRTKS